MHDPSAREFLGTVFFAARDDVLPAPLRLSMLLRYIEVGGCAIVARRWAQTPAQEGCHEPAPQDTARTLPALSASLRDPRWQWPPRCVVVFGSLDAA